MFYNILIGKLIYYVSDSVYTPSVELDRVLKTKIEAVSTSGINKLLSLLNPNVRHLCRLTACHQIATISKKSEFEQYLNSLSQRKGVSALRIRKRGIIHKSILLSLLLNFLLFIIFLRNKLIYYILDYIYILTDEFDRVLKTEIEPVSTSGIDKLLSLQNLKPAANFVRDSSSSDKNL